MNRGGNTSFQLRKEGTQLVLEEVIVCDDAYCSIGRREVARGVRAEIDPLKCVLFNGAGEEVARKDFAEIRI